MKNLTLIFILFLMVSCNAQTKRQKEIATVESIQPVLADINKDSLSTELPITINGEIDKIADLRDDNLQSLLKQEINRHPHWKSLVSKDLMSVGIVDLTDISNIKYAGLNDMSMMYAASLPKIAVLLAAQDAIDKGELEETSNVRKDMRLMISKSNNKATTRMIDRVGYKKIEAVLRAPKHKLYDEEVGGGLWVGKRYAAGGATYREPLKNLSHAATTMQVCSFYYQLVMGNLISTERSANMLDYMVDPELHHKFVNTLDRVAPKAKIYRKSGSWKNYHSDSALVWGPNRKYIIVALIDDGFGEKIIRDLVVPLEKVMKKARRLNTEIKS